MSDSVQYFDKEKCLNNIVKLLAITGKKIGNIEQLSGVCKGYLSRIRLGQRSSSPSIEFLTTAAKEFKISLDALVFSEISEMPELNSTQMYLYQFIMKLIDDTNTKN